MKSRALAVALALAAPAGALGQVLSPQQIDFIVNQVLGSLSSAVDGTFVVAGTLPPDRLSEPVPSDLLVEADPAATSLAQTAQAAADAAAAAAAAAQSVAGTASTAAGAAQDDVDALDARVGTLESDSVTWDAAAVQAAAYAASPGALNGFTTNLVLPSIGYTAYLYFAQGALTNAEIEETP